MKNCTNCEMSVRLNGVLICKRFSWLAPDRSLLVIGHDGEQYEGGHCDIMVSEDFCCNRWSDISGDLNKQYNKEQLAKYN